MTALTASFNPAQARAPRGTQWGGQWINTPTATYWAALGYDTTGDRRRGGDPRRGARTAAQQKQDAIEIAQAQVRAQRAQPDAAPVEDTGLITEADVAGDERLQILNFQRDRLQQKVDFCAARPVNCNPSEARQNIADLAAMERYRKNRLDNLGVGQPKVPPAATKRYKDAPNEQWTPEDSVEAVRDALEPVLAKHDLHLQGGRSSAMTIDDDDDDWHGYDSTTMVAYKILDANSNQVGLIQRKIDGVDDVVTNDYFRLNPEYQGRGIGSEVTAALEDQWRATGFREVHVHANIDVGGYTWARLGFELRDPSTAGMLLNRIEGYATERQQPLVDSIRQRIDSGEKVSVAELATIGWEEGSTEWPGKLGLLGSDWQGIKNLTKDEAFALENEIPIAEPEPMDLEAIRRSRAIDALHRRWVTSARYTSVPVDGPSQYPETEEDVWPEVESEDAFMREFVQIVRPTTLDPGQVLTAAVAVSGSRPKQARAPRGTREGGQWIRTALGILESVRNYARDYIQDITEATRPPTPPVLPPPTGPSSLERGWALSAGGNPEQARAPRGTPQGGQWIPTPVAVLRSASRLMYGTDVPKVGRGKKAVPVEIDLDTVDRDALANDILIREGRPDLATTAARVVDLYDRSTQAERDAGAVWYAEANALAQQMADNPNTDLSMEQAAAVIANGSIRTNWATNEQVSLAIADGARTKPEVDAYLQRARAADLATTARRNAKGEPVSDISSGAMGDNVKQAIDAADSPDPIGRDNVDTGTFSEAANKTRTFASNIMGDADGVTVDTHMYRVLGQALEITGPNPPGVTKKQRADQVYEALAQAVRVAARERNWSPAAMQAITWVWAVNNLTAATSTRPAFFTDPTTGEIIPVTIQDTQPLPLAAAAPPLVEPETVLVGNDDGVVFDYYYEQAQNLLGLDVPREGAPPPLLVEPLLASVETQARVPSGSERGGQWTQTPFAIFLEADAYGRTGGFGPEGEIPLPQEQARPYDLDAGRSPETLAKIARMDARYPARPMQPWTEQYRTFEPEARATTNAVLREIAASPTNIQVKPGVLDQIVADGQFLTSHHEEAVDNSIGKGRYSYMVARDSYEHDVLGVPQDWDTAAMPVYGWKGTQVDDQARGLYGPVTVVLKQSTHERTTITVGDSLNNQVPGMWTSDILASDDTTSLNAATGGEYDYGAGLDDEALGYVSYIEAQVHGGVSLSDIDWIEVPYNGIGDMDPDTLAALRQAGIAIHEADPVDDPSFWGEAGAILP